ncbi:MAG: hypothetical protein IIA14_00615 [SAR324 cluster bacterium]|nr:hypothetical protein [SAR324 cluster bacterium]
MVEQPLPARGFSGFLAAPLLVGAAYGLGKTLPAGWGAVAFNWPSPFTVAFLSGVLIAFACRPVLSRVPWSRGMAMGMGLAFLVCLGGLPDWAVAALAERMGIAAFPYDMPRPPGFDLIGIAAAALAMGLLFRLRGGWIDAANLRARLRMRPLGAWAGRIALLAAGATLLSLLFGWADGLISASGTFRLAPLVSPNPWFKLLGALGTAGSAGNGAVPEPLPWGIAGSFLLAAFYWLRGVLLFLPLVAIALVVRAKSAQMALVFSLLLFILGEFVPLMQDQPYFSTDWLILRTALGALRAAILGTAAALLITQRAAPSPVQPPSV